MYKPSDKDKYIKLRMDGVSSHYEENKRLLKLAQNAGFTPIQTATQIVESLGLTTDEIFNKIDTVDEHEGMLLNFIPLKVFDSHYMRFPTKEGSNVAASLSESLGVLKHAIKYHVLRLTKEQVFQKERKRIEYIWDFVITKC